jgi:predicted DNA-binding protein (UPF0251 family)
MPRPPKPRFVRTRPLVDTFLPDPLSPWGREEVVLSVEGLEAIRLNDFEGLDQERAARQMNVSRQTFGRILAEARMTVAEALVMGKVLHIGGGHFIMSPRGRRRRRHGWGGQF